MQYSISKSSLLPFRSTIYSNLYLCKKTKRKQAILRKNYYLQAIMKISDRPYVFCFNINFSLSIMIPSFKKYKSLRQCKNTEAKSNYIVEMAQNFPFEKLREIIDQKTTILVRRRLAFSSPIQKRVIAQADQKLQQICHDSLIKFHYSEQEEGSFSFYYEYVHITLEKWIVNLGDDVLDNLKNQMLDLSSYLNANGIAFTFDPRFVGLNEEIRLKYFLGDFSIIDAGQQQLRVRNQAANRMAIQSFFQKFKNCNEQNGLHFTSSFDHRETMCESVTVRESQQLARNSIFFQSASKSKITAKLERTKNRTYEILNRLKNIRNLQF